uniref:Uncharacterized protein n=1 Tax=Arundo donax TaxID=35708 RepID=A0A0A8XPQ2_ARUDO
MLQSSKPNLSCKNTRHQQMLNRLVGLITEGASSWMWETPFGQSVRDPASVKASHRKNLQ